VVVDSLAGRYELEQLISSGVTASLYRGFDKRLERRVAVKILHPALSSDPAMVERFRSEARAVARLSHPNLVSVIDRGAVEGREFIVLEYVEGRSLRHLLLEDGRPTVRRALELASEIGQGLAYAHGRGVVHLDVKPENVLVGRSGAKMTDVGVAGEGGAEEQTDGDIVPGTSRYLSPEQASGRATDERSNVYSLGVVLFELLTADVPSQRERHVEPATQHLGTAPLLHEVCPDASPRLVAAVERALEQDPGRRFASMDAFVAELNACLEEETDDEQTVVMTRLGGGRRASEARRRPRRLRAALLVGVLVTLAVVGAGLLGSSGSRSGSPIETPAALAASVHLRAVAPYDPPPGDGVEGNARLSLATDGDPATYWATEWYANRRFGNLKGGVGIVLDAARAVRLSSLRVSSDTPGYRAMIEAGASVHGPFHAVSAEMAGGATTVFPLKLGRPARYYLIWITSLSPGTAPHYQVHLNEVSVG
jgi:eukaryotic-like serine/threonine-protein kinase